MRKITKKKFDEYSRLKTPPRKLGLPEWTYLLFGGFWKKIFYVIIIFSLIMSHYFEVLPGIYSLIIFQGELETVKGEVLGFSETNFSENDEPVYKIEFEFNHPELGIITGNCYKTGTPYLTGANVKVEYLSDNPFVSRIKGTRYHFSLFGILIVFVFLFMAAATLWMMIINDFRVALLMRYGIVGKAQLKERRFIKEDKNENRIYQYTFTYLTENGENREYVTKSIRMEELEDEKFEIILYHPTKKKLVWFIDQAINKIIINEKGEFVLSNNSKLALLELLFPVIIVGIIIFEVLVFLYNI